MEAGAGAAPRTRKPGQSAHAESSQGVFPCHLSQARFPRAQFCLTDVLLMWRNAQEKVFLRSSQASLRKSLVGPSSCWSRGGLCPAASISPPARAGQSQRCKRSKNPLNRQVQHPRTEHPFRRVFVKSTVGAVQSTSSPIRCPPGCCRTVVY